MNYGNDSMQIRAPSKRGLILTVVLSVVSWAALYFWDDYRRVQQLVVDVKALGGDLRVDYRGPEWIAGWVRQHHDSGYLRWLYTDVQAITISHVALDDDWMS